MKYSLTLAMILGIAGATYSQAEDVLPPQYNFDRYSKMVDQSPFAVATAVAAPAATPDFAKDLYIANAARSQDGDLVTIASSGDHNFKKYLTTKEPMDGYSISSIEWSDKVGQTKVTISKDGNFATLTFNQALLSQVSPGGGVGARPLPAPAIDAGSKSRRRPECTCTEIARQCATGITTVDSFAGRDAAAYAWHDSTEPKDDEGIQWRGR